MKKFTPFVCLLAMSLIVESASVNAQRITVTIAGTGYQGYTGDGGPAKSAKLNSPTDVCMDPAHNLYFIDNGNRVIRKIAANTGVVTTYAGGGTSTADGVPATTAVLFDVPSPNVVNYMCSDASGNLYITSINKIRKIDAVSGLVTTIAGQTANGFSGDGGPATAALLDHPVGICMDAAGNIYFADRINNRIRKISATTGIITTIAGIAGPGVYTGDGAPAIAAGLNKPACICINPAGDVFFSDQSPLFPSGVEATRIRKIDAATGNISTIAGGNAGGPTCDVPATTAFLGTTSGLCIDHDGNLKCDEISCSCRKVDFATDSLKLVGGNFLIQAYSDDQESSLANMNYPYGLCVDNSSATYSATYIADSKNNRIRKIIDLTHTPTFAFGRGQQMNPVTGANIIDTMLWITDLDNAQTETWTVLVPPTHGTLTGFPKTAPSMGTVSTTKPSSIYYTPSASYAGVDLFKVRVSDGGLSDTVTIYVGSFSTTNVPTNNIPTTATINVFPNPATTQLTITSSEKINTIAIANVLGQTVFTHDYNSENAQVDVANLPAGMYSVKVNGTAVRKFVKE